MTETLDSPNSTEFTNDWEQFERRLAGLLESLAEPTIVNDIVRIRYAMSDNTLGEVVVESSDGDEAADFGCELRDFDLVTGVRVQLPNHPSRFYSMMGEAPEILQAAHDVCLFLRDDALVPHPSLLTAAADGRAEALLGRLGLPGPDGVLREVEVRQLRVVRRIAQREVPEVGVAPQISQPPQASWPEISWPASVQEKQDALEQVLTLKYGSVDIDRDDDYVIDTSAEGGSRFYLTVINNRPLITFRKAAVIVVNSRQAAVIEANYLNRENADIRWTLRGHTLYQELLFTTAPFVPVRFVEMLDLFDEQYRNTVSALRMRLGGDL